MVSESHCAWKREKLTISELTIRLVVIAFHFNDRNWSIACGWSSGDASVAGNGMSHRVGH